LAFAISPDMKDVQTARYSFRMLRNFGPTDDYLDDVRRVPGPVRVFVGSDDEIHKADQYAPLLKPVRSDVKVTIIPGFGHMDVTIRPSALEVIAAAT
jgi:pimeloyl-ACP methyl ester carboxylesterase